jgi:hypothetical protein
MHIQRRRHVNPAIQSSSDSRIQSAMERGGSDPSAIGVVFLSMGRTNVTKRSLSSVAAIFRPRDYCGRWTKSRLPKKKSVQTSGWGWAIVMELFRLLREITLWSHFYRGSENTCLDRAHEGQCGHRLRRA